VRARARARAHEINHEMNQAFDWHGLARGTFQGSKAVVEKKEC